MSVHEDDEIEENEEEEEDEVENDDYKDIIDRVEILEVKGQKTEYLRIEHYREKWDDNHNYVEKRVLISEDDFRKLRAFLKSS